jgi:hypothetical protein
VKIQTIKAEPSVKVARLINEANAAKHRILNFLDTHKTEGCGEDYVRACLRFADASFAVYAEQVTLSKIDRTKSLIGLPLFASVLHPQPIGAGGMEMYPVMQLDMDWVSSLCSKNFESCLLQFWWDTAKIKAYLRKIPLSDVLQDEQVPLEVSTQVEADGDLCMPGEWIQETKSFALQILKIIPIGVTFPSIDLGIDLLKEKYGDSIFEPILSDLEAFTTFSSSFEAYPRTKLRPIAQLFGYFYASQLDPDNFDDEGCLMRMEWRAGSGILFYNHDSAAATTEFNFYFD